MNFIITDKEGTLVHTGTKEQSDFMLARLKLIPHDRAPFTQHPAN